MSLLKKNQAYRNFLLGSKGSCSESYVKITENKAPTDDSIRLYKEMEEKARKEIINSFNVEVNDIKGKVMFISEFNCNINHLHDMGVILKININGKEEVIKDKIPSYEYEQVIKEGVFKLDSKSHLSKWLKKKVAMCIADKLLHDSDVKIG